MSRRPTYQLTITDAGGPGDAPAIIRLRSALKALLRSFAFRCVEATEKKTTPPETGGVV